MDAVVIGAGHNGLVAAAYLARAGLLGGGAGAPRHRRRRVRDGGAVAGRARLARRLHAVAAAPADHRRARSGGARPERRGPRALPVRAVPRRAQGRDVVGSGAHPRPAGHRLVARRRRRLSGLVGALGDGGGAGPAAHARAARPRALAGRDRAGDPRRVDRRGSRRHPERAGPRAVRHPGPDRDARGALGPRHRLRRLLPRPRRGGGAAGRVGLRARRDGRGHRGAARRRRSRGRPRSYRGAGGPGARRRRRPRCRRRARGRARR